MVFFEAVTFIVSLALVIKGADFFVKAASDIAKRLGVSDLIIGLTVVAVGTSLPELSSTIAASVRGAPGLIIGNIIGSNIANIGLIAGIAAFFVSLKTHKQLLNRDGYIMLTATLLFYLIIANGELVWWEGLILLLIYVAYLLFLIEAHTKKEEKQTHSGEFFLYFLKFRYFDTAYKHAKRALSHPTKEDIPNKKAFWADAAILVLSGVALTFGARWLIDEAIFFAELFAIPPALVGISAIAIGTSLPELAVTISAAKNGFGDMALGNVIGSNIANLTLVAGITSFIRPISISAGTLVFTAPVLIFLTGALLLFVRTKWTIQRREGIALVLIYLMFMAILVAKPALAW